MRIIALDLAYAHATGVAIFNLPTKDEQVELIPASDKKMPIWERQKQVYTAIMRFIQPDDLVFIEDYAYAIQSSSDARLKELGGLVRHMVWKRTGIFPIEVNVASLKKFTTGKGNAKKDLMLKTVFKVWGQDFDDDNAADAYALARLARAWVMNELNLTKYQTEVITKLRSSLSTTQIQAVTQWKRSLRKNILGV